MSLLDILEPRPEQIKASERQAGRSRTVMLLASEGNRSERKHQLLLIRKKRYRRRHPGTDKDIAKLRAWVAANPEKFRKAQKRWSVDNRDRINKASRDYRARKAAA